MTLPSTYYYKEIAMRTVLGAGTDRGCDRSNLTHSAGSMPGQQPTFGRRPHKSLSKNLEFIDDCAMAVTKFVKGAWQLHDVRGMWSRGGQGTNHARYPEEEI